MSPENTESANIGHNLTTKHYAKHHSSNNNIHNMTILEGTGAYGPLLLALADGLEGTSGPLPSGYFILITNEKKYPGHLTDPWFL